MQPDKRDEIVKKAVELAKKLEAKGGYATIIHEMARGILTLAAPPEEPLPWPGIPGRPEVNREANRELWWVRQG